MAIVKNPDEVPASPETLSAATLGASVFALGTCEILRLVRLAQAPLANHASAIDYAHVAFGSLFMTISFGALLLGYRLTCRRLASSFGGSLVWWLGARLSALTARAWLEIGLPTFGIGWLLMRGTRAWTPNVTAFVLFSVALVGSVPVIWLLDRLGARLRRLGSRHRSAIAPAALALATFGAVAWVALTEPFGMRYGKSHLVTFGLLVTWLSLVFTEALHAARTRIAGRAVGGTWVAALVVSGCAFVLPPSSAARELFYAERPTRWFGIWLARFGPDADGDGFEQPLGFTAGQDCDDHDSARNPRQPEIIGNGIDDNCFGGDETRSFKDLFFEPEAAREPAARVSNVLVIVLDSWRYDPESPGGVPADLVPVTAALARESLVFANYRTCAPRTLESFGDLFFGRLMPTFHGAAPTSAVGRLTAAGVHTVDISSRFRHEHDRVSGWWKELSIPGTYGAFGDSSTVAETEHFLAKGAPEPFFVATHLMGAHEPYEPATPCAEGAEPYGRYRCALRLLDRRVGEILHALSSEGLLDRTVVAVSADHGEEFGEHGARFHASTVYDEVLHVPLLVRIPGGKGELVREPLGCFDFLPTVLGAAGHPHDPLLIGHDFSRGPRPTERVQLARTRPLDTRAAFEPQALAVVQRGMKLLVDRQSGTSVYFDLGADPKERRPLARVNPSTEQALTQTMDAWLSELARQSLPDERTASARR